MQLTLTCLPSITIVPGTNYWHGLTGVKAVSAASGHLLLRHIVGGGHNDKNAKSMYPLHAESPPSLPATFYLWNRFMVLKSKTHSSNEFILNTEAKLEFFVASVIFYNKFGYSFVPTSVWKKIYLTKYLVYPTFLCEPRKSFDSFIQLVTSKIYSSIKVFRAWEVRLLSLLFFMPPGLWGIIIF